tara:strand:+ start:144 stop:416 length:273 start_codon:yes stop_codon:yes gene_type:complete
VAAARVSCAKNENFWFGHDLLSCWGNLAYTLGRYPVRVGNAFVDFAGIYFVKTYTSKSFNSYSQFLFEAESFLNGCGLLGSVLLTTKSFL